MSKYTREWRRKRFEQGLCIDCGKPSYGKWRCPECTKKNNQFHRTPSAKKNARLSAKRRRQELREEIIRLLGGKCSNPNCRVPGGMDDIRALQIDHISGNGRKEQKRFKNRESYYKHILEEIKKGSKDYQLLCANCNWIKRYELKEWTH